MERMIIKHLSGSKANQVEEFAIKHHNELIFGRDATATVKYDPDRDDLVGRQHAKIQQDPNDPNGFIVSDLSSRNGTFVNNSKITGPTKINFGDVVQFGPDGPKFQFDVEPRPANATKATRIADVKATPETRVTPNNAPINVPFGNPSVPTQVTPKSGVGKATVERMISATVEETKKQEGRKYASIGGAAAFIGILLIGSLAFGGYYYNVRREAALKEQVDTKVSEVDAKTKDLEAKNQEAQSKMEEAAKKVEAGNGNVSATAASIAEKNGKSVVYILTAWQLVNTQSKSQMFHYFVKNDKETLGKIVGKDLGKGLLLAGQDGKGPEYIPLYQVADDGKLQPVLTSEKTPNAEPIGATGSGSGFIVTEDGFILTNRHVADSHKANYNFGNYPTGVAIKQNGEVVAGVDAPRNWIPANTKSGFLKQFQGSYEGNQKLRVMLPGKENTIEAQLVQTSLRHDVSMIKISVPGTLPKVELVDNFNELKKGEQLVIMGYPGSSPKVKQLNFSKDFMNLEDSVTEIPDPTVSVVNIGNIVKSNLENLEKLQVSQFGDTIRYANTLGGGGNSGGPVFNEKGQVIGLHYAGGQSQEGLNIAFAVPIKFGLELFPGNNSKSGGS